MREATIFTQFLGGQPKGVYLKKACISGYKIIEVKPHGGAVNYNYGVRTMLTVIKENIWLVAGSVAVGFGAGYGTKAYIGRDKKDKASQAASNATKPNTEHPAKASNG